MVKLLEELWYGNIEPTEYAISPSKEYKELLHQLTQNEKTILERTRFRKFIFK